MQMWQGRAQSRCGCGRVSPVPVPMWHGMSPVPVQMPSPGADVAGASPVPVQMWQGASPRPAAARRRNSQGYSNGAHKPLPPSAGRRRHLCSRAVHVAAHRARAHGHVQRRLGPWSACFVDQAARCADRPHRCSHLHRNWAHPCRICPGIGFAPATSASGPGSRLPPLHQDWAHPCEICTGTGLAFAISAPGPGSPPATSAPGPTGLAAAAGVLILPRELSIDWSFQ